MSGRERFRTRAEANAMARVLTVFGYAAGAVTATIAGGSYALWIGIAFAVFSGWHIYRDFQRERTT